MATTETILIENLRRDTVVFRPVYKSGKAPAKGEVVKASERFQLRLGSKDDDTEEAKADDKIVQPRQAVPEWALAELKKVRVFANMVANGHVRVHREVA